MSGEPEMPLLREKRRPDDDVKSLRDAERALLSLFQRILHHHGLEKTRAMFANYCREPGKTEQDHLFELQLLGRLDAMPKPNVAMLARAMVAVNAALPAAQQDPRLKSARNLEQYIRRLTKKRAIVEARFAPVSPKLEPDEPAKFVITPVRRNPFRSRKN